MFELIARDELCLQEQGKRFTLVDMWDFGKWLLKLVTYSLFFFFLLLSFPKLVRASCWDTGCNTGAACFGAEQCDCSGNTCQWRSACNTGMNATVCWGTCQTQQEARCSICGKGCGPGPTPTPSTCTGTCTGGSGWVGDGSCGGWGVCSGGSCWCGCGTSCSQGSTDYRCSYDATENRCNTEKRVDCASQTTQGACIGGCTWNPAGVCYSSCTGSCGQQTCSDACGQSISCGSYLDPNVCATSCAFPVGQTCGQKFCTSQCGGTITDSCGSVACCDPNVWGSCSGSPATKTNQCGTVANCTGTIQAKSVVIPSAVVTCGQVQGATSGLSGTSFAFSAGSASQPPAQTQSGNTYVTFSSIRGGTYTLMPTAPPGFVLSKACWRKSLNATPGETTTTSLSVPTDGDTLIWDLGYTLGTAWFQTGGGGLITSGGNVQSLMSTLASPRYLSLAGTGGYPGVLTAAGTLDLDADPSPTARGYSLVSVPKWQAIGESLPVPQTDWYQWSVTRFGGSLAPDITGPLNLTKPAGRTAPYFLSGDFTTTGLWTIPPGEKLSLVVDGNVTIATSITVGTGGFFALIVKGNITIDPRVGGLSTSSTSVLDGVYITSPTGTILTGASSNPGTEKLVARGIFGGGAISLQRNLSSVGANATTPSEVFTYEPSFLMTMPEALKDMPISWEEVAP